MKRFCVLAVLMAFSSSADAGGSISFSVGGHRVHIESSRHCRSTSCASVWISGSRRNRADEDRDTRAPVRAAPPATQTVSPPPPPPPAVQPPAAPVIAAPPPVVYTPAASTTQTVAAPPPPPASPPVQPVSIPLPPPPPPAAKPVEAVQPAPRVERVSREVEDEVADSPVGDWQTEGKGAVRIAKCGTALCGYVLGSSATDKGEAILINMKPKTERKWTGSVYSQDSGDTYYGTMALKGINTLRVEACAVGRFYCSGNNWSRIAGHAENLMTSRQTSAEPRS
jgi:hypothetical protein